MKNSFLASVAALVLSTYIISAPPVHAASKGALATFEGQIIDLSTGWGEAKACTTDGTTTQCFRSEAEMTAATSTNVSAMSTACTPSVMLYSGTYFSGLSLRLNLSNVLYKLSTFNFDNVTSSFGIGYCDAHFYDGLSSFTAEYPGSTVAYASAAVMAAGWDNRISSVFIVP